MNNLTDLIKSTVDKAYPLALKLRHEIHQNPELSFDEYSTAKLIQNRLDELKIPYKSGIVKTGILAEIYGTKPTDKKTKTVLIRGDMDALPLSENTGLEFSSKHENIMHACGHDIHTATLLCCAEVINNIKEHFSGCVKLMFQPGEETSGGAEPMIENGILKNPDVDTCVAMHIEPSLFVGEARFKAGAAYSSPDEFKIEIIGKGGHGALPHLCIDPITIAAEVIQELNQIPSRLVDAFEPAVISVCAIHSGNAYNIIPDKVTLGGTARSFSPKTRDILESEIEKATKHICERYGAEYKYTFDRLFPPLINDEETILKLKASAQKYLSGEIIYGGNPTTAGEDFAYLPINVKHSALFWLGSTKHGEKKYPLHSDKLIADDECIHFGCEIFTDYAINFLND